MRLAKINRHERTSHCGELRVRCNRHGNRPGNFTAHSSRTRHIRKSGVRCSKAGKPSSFDASGKTDVEVPLHFSASRSRCSPEATTVCFDLAGMLQSLIDLQLLMTGSIKAGMPAHGLHIRLCGQYEEFVQRELDGFATQRALNRCH